MATMTEPTGHACTHHGEAVSTLRTTLAVLHRAQLRIELDLARYGTGTGRQAPPPGDALDALLRACPDLAREICNQVLGPVLALGDEDRRRDLLATLETWLATGSSRDTAARLFCHQNTILERLRAVKRLTGRDARVPADLLDLALAMRVYRTPDSPRPTAQAAASPPVPTPDRTSTRRTDGHHPPP